LLASTGFVDEDHKDVSLSPWSSYARGFLQPIHNQVDCNTSIMAASRLNRISRRDSLQFSSNISIFSLFEAIVFFLSNFRARII